MSRRKKRPFKITLTKTKDGEIKIDLEGEDPFSTSLLFGALQVVKEGTKKLLQKIDEISKTLPKR